MAFHQPYASFIHVNMRTVVAAFIGQGRCPFRFHAAAPLFVLAVLAIVPLAALLSHATESVAARTGDAISGLLNATLGNLTELIIAAAALRAGGHTLVKASIAGAFRGVSASAARIRSDPQPSRFILISSPLKDPGSRDLSLAGLAGRDISGAPGMLT
jgi:hypothetical protein